MSSLQLGYTILDKNYVKSRTLFSEHKTVETLVGGGLPKGRIRDTILSLLIRVTVEYKTELFDDLFGFRECRMSEESM